MAIVILGRHLVAWTFCCASLIYAKIWIIEYWVVVLSLRKAVISSCAQFWMRRIRRSHIRRVVWKHKVFDTQITFDYVSRREQHYWNSLGRITHKQNGIALQEVDRPSKASGLTEGFQSSVALSKYRSKVISTEVPCLIEPREYLKIEMSIRKARAICSLILGRQRMYYLWSCHSWALVVAGF